MFSEINTFQAWEYPAVARAYEARFSVSNPKAKIFYLMVFKGDELQEVENLVEEAIKDRIEVIDIDYFDLHHSFLEEDIKTYIPHLLTTYGYTCIEEENSYFVFGKVFEEGTK